MGGKLVLEPQIRLIGPETTDAIVVDLRACFVREKRLPGLIVPNLIAMGI